MRTTSTTKQIINISSREREILSFLSSGYTEKEIAKVLYLSHHTIHTHKKNLLQKFNARNCVHLVVKAVKGGLI